jgi:transposase
MVRKYINIFWHFYADKLPCKLPCYLDAKLVQLIETERNHDSRIRQCAATQACSMVKAVIAKHNKRIYKLKELQRKNFNVKYLQSKVDTFIPKKPNFRNINVELTARLVNFEQGNHFDLFVEIEQIGDKRSFRIPINHTKISNKWKTLGKQLGSIRLNEKYITLYYDVTCDKSNGTRVVGADQGQVTCLTLSDGQITKTNKHGYDLNKIQDVLSRRKKGSIGFRKAQAHRKNYVNWSLNQLNLDNIKEIRLEKILNLRKGKKSSRKLSHWCYPLIKDKLVSLSECKGFAFVEQSNKYRSQRCSSCGFTHKLNRLGKVFRCTDINCNFVTDSDLNAACNHEVDLIEVPIEVWNKKLNRSTGFYWLTDRVVYL